MNQQNLLHHDDDIMDLDGLQRAVVTEKKKRKQSEIMKY